MTKPLTNDLSLSIAPVDPDQVGLPATQVEQPALGRRHFLRLLSVGGAATALMVTQPGGSLPCVSSAGLGYPK